MSENEEAPVVNHVGQCVANLDRACRFYIELLGFVEERRLLVPDEAAGPLLHIDPPVGLEAAYLRRGAFTLELMAFDRPANPAWRERSMNERGLTHLSISVDDLDDVIAHVPEAGGEVVSRFPMAAIVRDPDGQLLELLTMDYRQRLRA